MFKFVIWSYFISALFQLMKLMVLVLVNTNNTGDIS